MTAIACMSRYRLRRLRQQIPLSITQSPFEHIEWVDSRLNRALGEVLADPKISKSVKIFELKQTLRFYKRLTNQLHTTLKY